MSKFGKYYKTVDAGLYQVNVFTEKIRNVNIKLQVEDISSQTLTTRDNITLTVDSVLYWYVQTRICLS